VARPIHLTTARNLAPVRVRADLAIPGETQGLFHVDDVNLALGDLVLGLALEEGSYR
jgi:hypothetical protein